MSYRHFMDLMMASSIGLFGTTMTFIVLWIRARERAIRAESGAPRRTQHGTPDIEHLVNAVDAIAVEVERISEGQRFTTKVMSELRALPQPDPSAALADRASERGAAPLSRAREGR